MYRHVTGTQQRTQRDKQIQRRAMHYLVRQYRSNPTPNTAGNIARLFAQRRHVTYGPEVIPVPRWI